MLQLATAINFVTSKVDITRKVKQLYKACRKISITNINKILRRKFVGKVCDSLSCKQLSKNLISIMITLQGAVSVCIIDKRSWC